MPLFTKTYSISEDFPDGNVNPDNLRLEIMGSSISKDIEYIDTEGDSILITFSDNLSENEILTLDGNVSSPAGGLISNHDASIWEQNDSYGIFFEKKSSDTLIARTTSDYGEAINVSADIREEGTYKISFFYVWGMSGRNFGDIRVRIQLNGDTKYTHIQEPKKFSSQQRFPVCGFFYEEATPGNMLVSMQFATDSNFRRNEAYMYNRAIEIIKVSE